jgi:hypothetical protein
MEYKNSSLHNDIKDSLEYTNLTEFNDLTLGLINNFSALVLPKNDTIKFVEFYPLTMEINDLLVDLEIFYPTEDIDHSLYIEQDIATPESKLYYPEPFIASPSFVHEEI